MGRKESRYGGDGVRRILNFRFPMFKNECQHRTNSFYKPPTIIYRVFPNNYVVECDPPDDDDEPSKPSLPRRTRKFDRKELDRKLQSMETKESSKEDETASLISRSGRNNSQTGAYEFVLEDSQREKRTSGQQFWDAINLFGCCGEERKHEKPSNAKPLRFTLWAHNMGNYAALFLIVGGAFAEYWANDKSDPKAQKHSNTGLGAYSILAGLIAAIFEYTCGLKRPLGVYEQNGFPARSVLQIILAIPAYFTVPTILGAAMLSAASIANFAASITNEYGDQSGKANKKRKKARKKAGDDDPFGLLEDIGKEGCCERVNHVIGRLKESDYLGQAVLSVVYWFINVLLFVTYYAVNVDGASSDWLPGAKGFAGILNFNMAIVIVPVTRTFLQWLNHQAASDSCFSWLKYLPLRKNIVFHKIIAFVVLFASIGHIICHLGNWAEAASVTTVTFGKARIYIIWVTGVCMAVSQFFLYTAAIDKVRRAEFQIFWINHHMFIVFLGFTIPHKPDWVLWFAIPALMYMYEKIQRYRRGSRPVILKEVRYIEPVLELRFEPTGMKFQDGQYVVFERT